MRRASTVAPCILFALASLCTAQSTQAEPKANLVIATREVPPFSFQGPDGQWRGISIDLWKDIADILGFEYQIEKSTLEEMLKGVADGRFDAAVAALTVTAKREKSVDFTQPFYHSGLGILVRSTGGSGWWTLARKLFSIEFAGVVGALAALLMFVGLLAWVFERRRNPDQFGGGTVKGLASGFWWSAVTMTTVGYGDKSPVTTAGRLIALVWMFASLILISTFTAAIASALTVSQLSSGIQGPEDLPGHRVATVVGSTSESYLQEKRVVCVAFDSPLSAAQAVADRRVEAAVFDAPVLKYLVKEKLNDANLLVLPRIFAQQSYAIALKENSPLRDPINIELLNQKENGKISEKEFEYLGG
jgi:ABC-type amino acid transport substrate-binding protein